MKYLLLTVSILLSGIFVHAQWYFETSITNNQLVSYELTNNNQVAATPTVLKSINGTVSSLRQAHFDKLSEQSEDTEDIEDIEPVEMSKCPKCRNARNNLLLQQIGSFLFGDF